MKNTPLSVPFHTEFLILQCQYFKQKHYGRASIFTPQEHRELISLYRCLLRLSGETLQKDDCHNLKRDLIRAMSAGSIPRNAFGMNPVIKDMQTAVIVAEEIGMRRASILGIMLHEPVKCQLCTLDDVSQTYGEDVAGIIRGLVKINELYEKAPPSNRKISATCSSPLPRTCVLSSS